MWQEICNSINSNGFFVGNLFGVNDEWNTPEDKRTFLNKQQVIELFNDFEIIDFKEFEKDRATALGKMKHWHIFEIIAKKYWYYALYREETFEELFKKLYIDEKEIKGSEK